MALTKEDLQAMGELIDSKLKPITESQAVMERTLKNVESNQVTLQLRQNQYDRNQAVMERDFANVKSDVGEIRENINAVQVDIKDLKQDASTMQEDIADLAKKVDINHISLLKIENIDEKVRKAVEDGYDAMLEKSSRIEPLERKVENHGTRIFALEQAAKAK